MRLPTTRDVAKIQQFLKASWEASQNWLWLALMWLSIAVNFSHIEDILSRWSGVSDWTTWGGAVVVEVISGLSWSNALTHLGTILASTGRSATKEKKRRARVYFGLSLVAGLIAVCFSAFANILWFNWHYTAGLVAPVATVICAVMEASRRYEIRVVAERREGTGAGEGKRSKICKECGQKPDKRGLKEGKCWRCFHLLRAKAAGTDRRSQILALAQANGGGTPLKQKEIAEILRTSPGWVSTVLRKADESAENLR